MEKKTLYVAGLTKSPKEVPINPDTDDPFYRYKMPQLVTQVIGKGKMIKTAFINIDDVATALKVPAEYIPRFIGFVIGAQPKYEPKKPPRERASISGEHDLPLLSEKLEEFIKGFVLCRKCTLPELGYIPLKSSVGIKCYSCGWKAVHTQLDLPQKFERFVGTHPPPKSATNLDKEKAARQKKEKQRQKEDARLVKAAEKLDVSKAEEEVEWATETSKEAVAARAAQSGAAKIDQLIAMAADEGANGSADSAAVSGSTASKNLYLWRKERETATTDEVVAQFQKIVSKEDITADAAFAELLVFGLFQKLEDVMPLYKQHKSLFHKYLTGKHPRQVEFLFTVEALAESRQDSDFSAEFTKKFARLLKAFYDDDVTEEEAVLEWHRKPAEGNVGESLRKSAQPIITWLEEAEEESSEE